MVTHAGYARCTTRYCPHGYHARLGWGKARLEAPRGATKPLDALAFFSQALALHRITPPPLAKLFGMKPALEPPRTDVGNDAGGGTAWLLAAEKVAKDVFPARHASKLSLRLAPDACASTLRMKETAKRTEMLPVAQGHPRLSHLRRPLRTHETRARRLSVFLDEVRDRATSLRHPRHGFRKV